MGFDDKRFGREKFEARTEVVPVPALAPWFGEGEAAEWKIRGLEGAEFARAKDAASKARATADIAAAMAAAAGSKEKVGAILEAAGIPADQKQQPEDFVTRLEMLVAGSVEPAIDLQTAVRLAKSFPIEFFDLTNRVMVLTGQGQQPGKSKPSGDATT